MVGLKTLRILAVVVALMAVKANAETFPEILRALTAGKKNVVMDVPELQSLMRAGSMESARAILQNKALADYKDEKQPEIDITDIVDLLRKRTLTIVIVPGVLGEFIDTRAFEEIFAKDSSFKREWEQRSRLAIDERFVLEKHSNQTEKLSSLMNAASIDDSKGKPLVKLVILRTLLGSLESVGSNSEKAMLFNRRLQKYMNIMKDQNLVLLGYSRGTPLALEMVTQAAKFRMPFFPNVKAVVSYAGVVAGSALADVTDDPNTASGQQLAAARLLLSKLQLSNNLLDRPGKRIANADAIREFLFTFAKTSQFDPGAFLDTARAGDFKTVMALIAKMVTELGFNDMLDFNGHVTRMKSFISQILSAVEGLKSKSMLEWWKTHKLPSNIKYYSIAAAMVDPEQSASAKSIFDSQSGYNNSLDDKSLLENQRAYTQVTGVSLNDSQVAVYQSLFLPEVIKNLNPQNAGLSMESLGLLETHHWGVALQVVNKMKDGRKNPFPRERVILALAAYLNQ